MRLRLSILLLIFVIQSAVLGAQESGTQVTPQQMRQDIDFYFNAIERIHPMPYQRYTRKQFDSVRLRLREACAEPKTLMGFVYMIALANRLTDEQSGITYLTDNARDIPSAEGVEMRQGTLWVGGKRIDRINGIDAKAIFEVTDGLVPWTYNTGERQRRMRMLLPYAAAVNFSLLLPYECQTWDPATRKPGSMTLEFDSFNSLLEYKMTVDRGFDPAHHANAAASLFFDKESIAVFYYNSSDPAKAEDVKRQADGFFTQVAQRGIKNIFIDVSQNGGGSEAAHRHILRHLNGNQFDYSVSYSVTAAGLRAVDSLWRADPARSMMIPRYREILAGKATTAYSMSANKGYGGGVFVIMGPSTFSSAADFCDHIKRSGTGVLVGQAAGQRVPYFGNAVTLYMPNTGLPFTCPTQRFVMRPMLVGADGFLKPDIPYIISKPMSAQDYLEIIKRAK